MEKTARRVWSTVLRGLVALVPLGVIVYMLATVLPVVLEVANALDDVLPFGHLVNLLLALAGAIASLFFVCFTIGALLGTAPGDAIKRAVDGFLEGTVPLYGAARKLAERVTGTEGEEFSPVEVDLYGSDARVVGLFIETMPGERCSVFVPMAPAAAVGQVYVVPRACVSFLEVPMQDAVGVLTEWGVGARKLYERHHGSAAAQGTTPD